MSEPREPNAYSAYNPDYFRDFPKPDTMADRQAIFDLAGDLEETMDPEGKISAQTAEDYTRYMDSLAHGIQDRFRMSESAARKPSTLQDSGILPALEAAAHLRALGYFLEDPDPRKDTNPAIFVTRGSDGALRSPTETPDGQLVSTMLKYGTERAPEIVRILEAEYPIAEQNAGDPNGRLFWERFVRLLSMKPPEDIHMDHWKTVHWNDVFEHEMDLLLRPQFVKPEIREQLKQLFDTWRVQKSA
ncbi:MAG: hypothetical protein AAB733_00700 [Patescibacteria group bacterium]